MTRIFFAIALFSTALLLAAMAVGLSIGDLTAAADETVRVRFRVHFLLGLAAALVVVFVSSIAVTYFIGTSRWCKEVVETYALDRELIRRSTKLKRRAFPWALGGMLTVVGIIALGAAADPATVFGDDYHWSVLHLTAAIGGSIFIAWSYLALWNHIRENHQVIEQVMQEVRRIRRERGLDVEGEQET